MRPISKAQVRAGARRVVVSRLVIVGGIVGGVVIGVLARRVDGGTESAAPPSDAISIAIVGMLTTGALSYLALRRSLAARNAGDTVAADLGRSIAAAIANAPACVLLHGAWTWALGASPSAVTPSLVVLFPLGLVALTIVAMVVSLPLGLAYGVVHVSALYVLRGELARPSWRALTRARKIGIVVALAGLCAIGRIARADAIVADLVVLPAVALAVLVAIDVSLLFLGWLRMRRWLARIHSDTTLRVVAPTQARVASALAPLVPVGDDALAVVSARATLPYRERPWAIALVPRRTQR